MNIIKASFRTALPCIIGGALTIGGGTVFAQKSESDTIGNKKDKIGITITEKQTIPQKFGYASHSENPLIILNSNGAVKYFVDGPVIYEYDFTDYEHGYSIRERLTLSYSDDLWESDRDSLYLLLTGANPKQPPIAESYKDFIHQKSSMQMWIIWTLIYQKINAGEKIEHADKFTIFFDKKLTDAGLRIGKNGRLKKRYREQMRQKSARQK